MIQYRTDCFQNSRDFSVNRKAFDNILYPISARFTSNWTIQCLCRENRPDAFGSSVQLKTASARYWRMITSTCKAELDLPIIWLPS